MAPAKARVTRPPVAATSTPPPASATSSAPLRSPLYAAKTRASLQPIDQEARHRRQHDDRRPQRDEQRSHRDPRAGHGMDMEGQGNPEQEVAQGGQTHRATDQAHVPPAQHTRPHAIRPSAHRYVAATRRVGCSG
jgi:hypothetical protein